jgi:hypothetical protein
MYEQAAQHTGINNRVKKKSLYKILINVLRCAKNVSSQLMQCHITYNSIEFMQWPNFMKGIGCLYVHKGTAWTL